MGYMRHHAIIVSSWDADLIKKAHAAAKEIYASPAPDPEFWDTTHFPRLVSPIREGVTNGYLSFAIFPDGSKEGWGTSDWGDTLRARFIEWLRSQADEEGGSSLDWVEVQFGDDENEACIVNSGDDDHEAFVRAHPEIYGVEA